MGSSSNVTFVRRHRDRANIGNPSLVFGPGAGGLGLGASNRTISHESINRSTDAGSHRERSLSHARQGAGGLEFAEAHQTGEMLFTAVALIGPQEKFKNILCSDIETCRRVLL